MRASWLMVGLLLLGPGLVLAAGEVDWPMFHHDERHTGLFAKAGNFNPADGPFLRWQYRVTPQPSEQDALTYRWMVNLPLGDLDGQPGSEVVVTTPTNAPGPPQVIVLKDQLGQSPPVRQLWNWTSPTGADLDTYGPALTDVDGDGLPDVVFSDQQGIVRALKGTNGNLLWTASLGTPTESGPMVGDLDGDGRAEVVNTAGCAATWTGDPRQCPTRVSVFAARASGTNTPLWSADFPCKSDSGEPAIADLDPYDGQALKALIVPTWCGKLYVVWKNAAGFVEKREYDMKRSDPGVETLPYVVRTAPLLTQVNGQWRATVGWLPNWNEGNVARFSAVSITANMTSGEVSFEPLWTWDRDTWKSSPAEIPLDASAPIAVAGYGIGTTQGTGSYGACDLLNGGVIAVKADGTKAWETELPGEGNIRGSAVVADIDRDGQLEVLLAVGCTGQLHAFDAATGAIEWTYQLGPHTLGTPSIGDLDGNGAQEVVIQSYDGQVWALEGCPNGNAEAGPISVNLHGLEPGLGPTMHTLGCDIPLGL